MLLPEFGLLEPKTINDSGFDEIVAKCLHTKTYKYEAILQALPIAFLVTHTRSKEKK